MSRRVGTCLLWLFYLVVSFQGVLPVIGTLLDLGSLATVLGWMRLIDGVIWIELGVAVRARRRARTRVAVSLLLAWTGLTPIVSSLVRASPPDSAERWFGLAMSILFIVVAVGVWRASEWARTGSGILGLARYGIQVSAMMFGVRLFEESMSLPATLIVFAIFVLAGPPVALAIYSVLPSTRRHFAEVREGRGDLQPRAA